MLTPQNLQPNSSYKASAFLLFIAGLTFQMFFISETGFAQKIDKVQQAIDGIKAANYCEDQDYHTDGVRVVWVKSYKKWEPSDFAIMVKERPSILRFLNQAIQRERYDVLEQLLPDYYRMHGGVKAFAEDIQKQSGPLLGNVKTYR